MSDAERSAPSTPAPQRRMPLHWKIAIGFFSGLALGLVLYALGYGEFAPAGLDAPRCAAGGAASWTCTPWVELLSSSIG
ncbi:hypothetical protein GCM10007067_25630 [Lysobacter bugurensis]|uniref:Uncharacterized protein n=1 Tax=Cognatilysobacter bugurensis TaxID=543356 RepID=A0A918WB75_9GAMM|nr:hypothetical protein GCM10007067_25630 [Lysobacter bugurensis]